MKTKEELNELKEEVETLNEKQRELTEEELAQVSGGFGKTATYVFTSVTGIDKASRTIHGYNGNYVYTPDVSVINKISGEALTIDDIKINDQIRLYANTTSGKYYRIEIFPRI